MVTGFNGSLLAASKRANSWLCIGLDPNPATFPADFTEQDTLEFCLGIVEATKEFACSYKPNSAFFEAMGRDGWNNLLELVEKIPTGIPVILDSKRNDIDYSAKKYAEAAFEVIGADAVTVNPYMGIDTIAPFASYSDKGVIICDLTSNKSAEQFQELLVGPKKIPLYQHIAQVAMKEWNPKFGNLGLVAGATRPEQLQVLRKICGDGVPLLIPGVGAQGAKAHEAFAAGADTQGEFAVVNVGRAILYAGKGEDWKAQAKVAAKKYSANLRTIAVKAR